MTEDRLNRIEERLERLEGNDQRIEQKLGDLSTQIREFDLRIDTYQKAYQQVVNLAFGLIVAATAAIVIPAVLNR
jgi:archaellum component FlaC